MLIAGICHSHYCFYNLSPEARITTTTAFETGAFLCETFVFVYLGLQVGTVDQTKD
jgi:NhaP-type Na+/H+ or K+/H+ antiporter